MSKFCKNCGSELNDDVTFCEKCGTPAEELQRQPDVMTTDSTANSAQEEGTQEAKPDSNGFADKMNGFVGKLKQKDKKAIGIVAGIVVVLALIVVLVICLSGGGAESALDTYMDVLYQGKASKVEKIAPPEFWDKYLDDNDMDMDDVEDKMKDLHKTIIRTLEDSYGDDIKISYKITDKDDVSKKDLDTMKDHLKSAYDIPKKSVTDACEFDVEMKIKGDDDEDTDDATLYAVKIDGDWYICSSTGDFLS